MAGRRSRRCVAREALAGRLFGVWNTEAADGVRLVEARGDRWRLEGSKIYASGAGHVQRPLITARTADGSVQMVVPQLAAGERADLSGWIAHGMRASATGTLDFTGLEVASSELIGEPGDYLRQPIFSAGAWRFAAVHLGGIERLLDELRGHLVRTRRRCRSLSAGQGWPGRDRRRDSPAVAGASMPSRRGPGGRPDTAVAYVNLARLAVERAALDVLELTHRSIGLAGFLRTHPVERLSRDLTTYLRQPAPDRALAQAAAHVLASPASSTELWSCCMIRAGDYLRLARGLPTLRLEELTRGRGLVVVAPHADDESLGCGGLIAAACAQGATVRIVLLSDGTGSHPNSRRYPAERLRALREAELVTVPHPSWVCLNEPSTFFACPTGRCRAPGPNSTACCHQRASRCTGGRCRQRVRDLAARPALRPSGCLRDRTRSRRSASQGARLYAYPVWGWTLADDTLLDEPEPIGGQLDIGPYLARKRRAIQAHRSQMTGLIDDDPLGFQLPPAFLAQFDHPREIFLEIAP